MKSWETDWINRSSRASGLRCPHFAPDPTFPTMPPSCDKSLQRFLKWIFYPRWINLSGCFEADVCESSRIVWSLSGRIWSNLRCVVSPCQRCGTGCSSGVSSPRSSSTGPWGCSCWSCCSATRGAASSPWCWSAWVSWPPSPGASSPVSPITSVSLSFFFFPSISSLFRLTSAAFSRAGRWREVTGRKRRRVRRREMSDRGRQELTDGEGGRGFRLFSCLPSCFCVLFMKHKELQLRPQFWKMLSGKNAVFTPSNTGIVLCHWTLNILWVWTY